MTDELKIARNYLIPPQDAFWEWQDKGDVITWADGRTITFRLELAQVLNRLAPDGLPPLGAILLLLAATRDSWGEVPNESGILAGCLKSSGKAWKNVDALYDVIEGLERVRQLEPELRSTPEAKSNLSEVIFERSAGRTSADEAAIITRHLYRSLDEVISAPAEAGEWQSHGPNVLSRELGPSVLLREFRCLQSGLNRVDPEILRLRRETGLDTVPHPAELDLPAAQRVRTLLAELEKDDELRGLAKLAHHLMAAVTLPRAVTDHEELQVGGVSDITNRGPLDRLLLSELAHDDLTLAVRVAMNEALYLRRESPPRTPSRHRAVFLEAGIRSWGVPRVYATAVALALTATTERNTEVVTFRAKGNGVEPVDLTTRAGLVAHLAALEPELHPGEALEAFEMEIDKAENAAEPVLVTTEDVLEDKEFQRSLTECNMSSLHVATVNRDGRFRLLEQTSRGSKQFREATLDLEEFFKEPSRVTPTLLDREWARDLPAIFSVEPFPLLLSHNLDPKRMWSVTGRGVLTLTKDRRLMFWTRPNQGAYQLADNIPRGAFWWSSREPLEHGVRAVVGYRDPHGLHMLHIDLDQHRCVVQPLDIDRGVQGICSHNGVLFAVYQGRVQVVGEESGEVVQTLDLPVGMTSQRGRFFRGFPDDRWYALSYDGRTAHLERVLDKMAMRCPRLLTLFERDGVDGPIGITAVGDLYSTGTGILRKVKHGLSGDICVLAISQDGSRIVLGSTSAKPIYRHGREVVVDVDTLTVDSFSYHPKWITEPEFQDYLRPTNIRHRFTHIGLDQNGLITLISRKQLHVAVDYVPGTDQIVLRGTTDTKVESCRLCFENVPTQPHVGFRWSRATWHDGSDAFLDSRGLLHLRSSDNSLPEVSIVLTDNELAGWCSDGRVWGARYYIGEQDGASKRQVFETVIKAFAERLR